METPAATANAATLLKLARDAASGATRAAEATALDRLLAADPRNIPALMRRADLYAAAGDARSASSFYLMAIRSAPASRRAPRARRRTRARKAGLRPLRARVPGFPAAQPRREGLRPEAIEPALRATRWTSSSARSASTCSSPSTTTFPGLPQVQFYERSLCPWFDDLEAATADIRAELEAVLHEPDAFAPYVQGHANRPKNEQMGMMNNPAWSAYYLWKNGEPVAGNVERFPKTMQALRNAPLAHVPNRSPSILFSLLRPGAHIPPHNGLVNTRFICHLPVIDPGKCRFRVGNETRDWVQGKGWAFDDSIEHEAWNGSDKTRVILLFDVWRPELTDEERRLVVSLFETIDAHSGKKPDWEI